MTNDRLFAGIARVLSVRPLAAALALLLTLPLIGVQAQSLRPSSGLRLPTPAASAGAAAGSASGQRQADFIVAVVNSEPITNSEVRTKLVRTEQQIIQQGSPLPPRRELVPQVLERLISDKAQLQLARSAGMRVDDNAVEAAVQTVARQNQISVDELRRRLKADGIAYSQFESDLRDELLVSRLRQREVDLRVTVTEQDIDQFLREQEGGTELSSLALNLAQILVAVPENATPGQVAALQAKAQQVMDKARGGADFAALANEFSDSPTRGTGGLMGLREADRYPPLFVESTKSLKVGGLAGPIRSGAGFHILKVIEKRQAGMPGSVITQTHARHILLRLSPKQGETAATEKLAALRKRILAGQADFAALARENSEDASAKQGGDLGWANPGMFVPEFEKVMNGLAPNQISDPLVSRFGVHLIQVLERREAQMSQRDQREMARNVLRGKKQEEAYVLWAQEVRGRAYVEYRESPQ
ncbi:peptidylprolyl isomerase [Polaromonas sp. JS666]|uniref:Chaperone SurA n=1 Tax=Polaromonas sp. (strain JS666 / ATCC BAA-500) TaxID=296591 RepID=SURA_POLSJ|nr:peptidylprolyl isomerase [Polaromonas sp. JS666]Q121Q4.1 RecName: Full=Chaperone SurA; AltName: Full=Peptidyl-prolyl cis-trans isomerase SurA; Short=PPIase SurA; AltName: Full=Rotamase SurA; Flags: Precursor [Polaromonas sp. JS666]ABE46738.1 PpiC-type peptidyl-prolyl cis-trans isomerase [Polaromonas sp. JS666]